MRKLIYFTMASLDGFIDRVETHTFSSGVVYLRYQRVVVETVPTGRLGLQ
jgi:hypothetical protein